MALAPLPSSADFVPALGAVVLAVVPVAVVAVGFAAGSVPIDCCFHGVTPGTLGAWRPE